MGQKKLQRFAELKAFPNAFEYPEHMKGKWGDVFKNNNPITLELACGKGEYAVGLGRLYSERNFIGVDLKGNRMWVGAKKALDEGLTHVVFLRSQIERIAEYFDRDEVNEVWITFPDPQLRSSKAKKRLTHPRFLRLYQSFLSVGGTVNLKTDSPDLYNFTKLVINLYGLTLLEDVDDLYQIDDRSKELKIETHYEKLDIAKSNKIHYLKFTLDKELPFEIDEQLKRMLIEQEAD